MSAVPSFVTEPLPNAYPEMKERCCPYWDWKLERQSCEVISVKMITVVKLTVRFAGDKNPEQGRLWLPNPQDH